MSISVCRNRERGGMRLDLSVEKERERRRASRSVCREIERGGVHLEMSVEREREMCV